MIIYKIFLNSILSYNIKSSTLYRNLCFYVYCWMRFVNLNGTFYTLHTMWECYNKQERTYNVIKKKTDCIFLQMLKSLNIIHFRCIIPQYNSVRSRIWLTKYNRAQLLFNVSGFAAKFFLAFRNSTSCTTHTYITYSYIDDV